MSLAGEWTDQTAGSSSKMNFMTILSLTGDELEALDKTQFRIVFCTANSTGDNLIQDHIYVVDTAAEAFIDVLGIPLHRHDNETTGGGRIEALITANSMFIDTGAYYVSSVAKSKWLEAVSSTGSVADDTTGGDNSILLSTGATSGSLAQITQKALNISFASRSIAQAKIKIGTLSSLNYRFGVRIDQVTSVDSNAEQYAAEICTATNNNWWCRSASGSGHSMSDSAIAATTNKTAIKLEHYPDAGPRVDMYIDASSAFQKTSDVPTASGSSAWNIMRHSFKNSAASNRTVFVHGSRVAYYTSDNWI